MDRKKKVIKEMMPVKKWLSHAEAIAYVDMSSTSFLSVTLGKLTVSTPGKTKYYRVAQLDKLFEDAIIINCD